MIDPNVQELLVGANEIQSFKRLKMKQFDKNLREFRISLIEDGELTVIPSGYVAKFQATKPDKTIVLDNCTIVDNVVIYKPKEQLSTVAGTVECEIGFYIPDPEGNTNEDGLIQSVTFEILVEKSAMDRNAVISSNEFNTLTIMINTITGLIVEANEALSQIEGVIESEEGRVIAENGRVDAEEIRVQKDLTRPDYIYLTQAQYDALPLIEKEDINKIYEITDDDGELPNELEALILDTQNAATAAWAAASASLPDVGTAGTYTKVTTDSKGRVTNGSTPTNIGDLGITNVYNKTEIDNKTGDLSTLATIEKNNLVGAINENTSLLADNVKYFYNLAYVLANPNKVLLGDSISTLGFYSPMDGGAASYKIVATTGIETWFGINSNACYITENGDIKITESLKAVLWRDRESYNVKQFGAVGNGVVDDWRSCQACCNKQRLAYFPSGNYKMITGLLLQYGNKIKGECVGTTALNITGGITALKMKNPSITEYNIQISDITINGDGTGGAMQSGIDLTGMSRAEIRNVSMWNCKGSSIRAEGQTNSAGQPTGFGVSYYNWLYNVHAYGCGTGVALWYDVNDWTFVGGSISTCVNGITMEKATNNKFIGFSIETTTNTAINLNNAHYCSFIGGRIESAATGINENSLCTNNAFVNNRIISAPIVSSSKNSVYWQEGIIKNYYNYGSVGLANSWANIAGRKPVNYTKDTSGRVYLEGDMNGGTLNTVAFILRADCIPSTEIEFITATNNGTARVKINTSGSIIPIEATAGWTRISLEGINFIP